MEKQKRVRQLPCSWVREAASGNQETATTKESEALEAPSPEHLCDFARTNPQNAGRVVRAYVMAIVASEREAMQGPRFLHTGHRGERGHICCVLFQRSAGSPVMLT